MLNLFVSLFHVPDDLIPSQKICYLEFRETLFGDRRMNSLSNPSSSSRMGSNCLLSRKVLLMIGKGVNFYFNWFILIFLNSTMDSSSESSIEMKKSLEWEEILAFGFTNLAQMIPELGGERVLSMIRSNMGMFMRHLQKNNDLLYSVIDYGIKTHQFESQHHKKLCNFSVDLLCGDFGSAIDLLIREDTCSDLNDPISSENTTEKEVPLSSFRMSKQSFLSKYHILLYILEYTRRPCHQISCLSINYLVKLLLNIIQSRIMDLYTFFYNEEILAKQIYASHSTQNSQLNSVEQSEPLGALDILIDFAYRFGSVSEMLGKLIGEEGETNKFQCIKEKVIKGILKNLCCESNIETNTENYENLLDFIVYCFMRNKYRNDEGVEQFTQITQRFVDEDTLWFFKEKLIQSVIHLQSFSTIGTNANKTNNSFSKEAPKNHDLLMHSFVMEEKTDNSDSSIRFSHKESPHKQNVLTHKYSFSKERLNSLCEEKEIQDLVYSSSIVFHNALTYLILVAERINVDEEIDPYMSLNSDGKPEPTMDFHVDEVLFSEDCLFEIMTLNIPSGFQNLQKMRFYEFLLLLTKNSRFAVKSHDTDTKGLRRNTLINILIHLLKAFHQQFKGRNRSFSKKTSYRQRNSMVKFYIQQIITHAVLPKIQKFETKEAMMILSALKPQKFSEKANVEDRSFLFKIFAILEEKCEWISPHFKNTPIDLAEMKKNFTVALCGDSNAIENRSYSIKEFQFLSSYVKENRKKMEKSNNLFESSCSSNLEDLDLNFSDRKGFEYPNDASYGILKLDSSEKIEKIEENNDQHNDDSEGEDGEEINLLIESTELLKIESRESD